MPVNFEFKARVSDLSELEKKLLTLNPEFIGEDLQTDTYYKVSEGRLKLREGNIENALILYYRSNIASAKTSDVILYQHIPEPSLKKILERSLGIKVIVEKKRRIYFINNVKIHFDEVKHLGSFLEVEAIDEDGWTGMQTIKSQCLFYAAFFSINPTDYVSDSYSDMILNSSLKSMEGNKQTD